MPTLLERPNLASCQLDDMRRFEKLRPSRSEPNNSYANFGTNLKAGIPRILPSTWGIRIRRGFLQLDSFSLPDMEQSRVETFPILMRFSFLLSNLLDNHFFCFLKNLLLPHIEVFLNELHRRQYLSQLVLGKIIFWRF